MNAPTAKAVRQELKKEFPGTKFSVRTRSRSSVNVEWKDGAKFKDVENLLCKYERGSFNGMQDIYEYTNKREDIPQTDFVFIDKKVSMEFHRQATEKLKNNYNLEGSEEDIKNMKIVPVQDNPYVDWIFSEGYHGIRFGHMWATTLCREIARKLQEQEAG